MLNKLKEFLATERVRKAVQAAIVKRSRRKKADTRSLEGRLAEIRSRIDRGTENLALAMPEDIPGISRLLSQWRQEAAQVNRKLEAICDADKPTTEALETIQRYDELLEHLEEADREKLSHAICQTVKRITLRRERRERGRHRVKLWTGTIELQEEFGENITIPLNDDDIPSPGRWREAVQIARAQEDGIVFLGDIVKVMKVSPTHISSFLAQAVLADKLINLGHQKGWKVVE